MRKRSATTLQCDDLPLIPAVDTVSHTPTCFISLLADAESSIRIGGQAKIVLRGSPAGENHGVSRSLSASECRMPIMSAMLRTNQVDHEY